MLRASLGRRRHQFGLLVLVAAYFYVNMRVALSASLAVVARALVGWASSVVDLFK